jgi:hypothetical protein
MHRLGHQMLFFTTACLPPGQLSEHSTESLQHSAQDLVSALQDEHNVKFTFPLEATQAFREVRRNLQVVPAWRLTLCKLPGWTSGNNKPLMTLRQDRGDAHYSLLS